MTILIALAVIIGAALPVHAQQRALDQDFFTANDTPENKELLEDVDFYHTREAAKFIQEGNTESALLELIFTLESFPNHPRALQLVGAIARIRKVPEVAIPFYQKALRLYPQYALTHAQYGGFLVDVDQAEEGVVKLKRAIEMDPELAIAHKWLSRAYAKMGLQEWSRQAAEKAKDLESKLTKDLK